MGGKSKQRTTMAKLNREAKLRQRRMEKEARKAARKTADANPEPRSAGNADPLDTPSD
jgi:hypothetical protein